MTFKLNFAGFNYVADVDGSYASANSLGTMISETAANAVALTADFGIDAATSTVYGNYTSGGVTGNTETAADLLATIGSAEADGLSVMVRPLIDFLPTASAGTLLGGSTQYAAGDWRAYYEPSNPATFFASYQSVLVAEATTAQQGGAQIFDIGTELDQLTGPAYQSYWTTIITAVRAVFHGALTYSAIDDDALSPWQYGPSGAAAGTGNLATQVSFWSQLDYIGIDEYAAISDASNGGANPDPTLTQLIAGWENAPADPTTYAMTGGLSLIQYYENLSATIGKPLLFTELGYNSAPDAASQPAYTSSGVYDPTLQANLYQAFVDAWQADGNTSLEGVYLWNWEPDPSTVGAGTYPSWTPQGNAGALQVIDAAYAAAEPSANLHLKFAGFNYVADIDGSYASADSLSTMISSTASNAVALTDDYGIDAQTNGIYPDYSTATTTGNTETIPNMVATIKEAVADGLSVMVRPLMDFTADATTAVLTNSKGTQFYNGEWRAYYNPGNASAFLTAYTGDIVSEASAAQLGGAQIFDIGTEMDQLTGPKYLSYWTTLINDVRAVFHGALTYSAISDDDLSPWQYGGTGLSAGTGDITTQISFWNQLDYVGIDEYAAISDASNGGANPDPTLTQLIAGWEDTPADPTTLAMTGGLSLIQYYENVAQITGKPLLFTELGYNSAPDAASQPFYTSSNTYDPALQANLYQAFVTAWQAQGNTSLQGVYLWNWEPDSNTVGAGTYPSWTPQGNTGALQVLDAAFTAATACYARGTRIETVDGVCAVENLALGQRVRLASGGSAPVVWLGHRRVECARHPRPHDVLPILVQAGAFGGGRPVRDLRLSPDHAVLADGVLIPVRYLVNGRTIAQIAVPQVEYWHVELPVHGVMLAEGLPCESYLDTGNRSAFANGGGTAQLHPNFARDVWAAKACAPLVLDGPQLAAVKRRLLAEAGALTEDPGLRVLADGTALDAHSDGRRWRVRLPEGARTLRLVSSSWTPAHTRADETDTRTLGVAIARLWLDGREAGLDSPALCGGWHAAEPGWRWTAGDAALALGGVREVAFDVAMTGTYWRDDEEADSYFRRA